MFKTATSKRIAVVTLRYLILIAAGLLIAKAFVVSIDQYSTREITLVRVNGSTFCQSCMGLYK